MTAPRPFHAFGPSHWAVLGLSAALTVLLVWLARRPGRERTAHVLGVCLAVLLLGDEIAVVALAAHADLPTLKDHLPFQLCDWVIFAAVAALLWRRRLAYELAYFWGLAGTLQALLTPDLAEDFPNPHFFTFQILHAGVVVAVLYLTFGLGFRPTWRSLLRAWAWLQIYIVATIPVDWLLDSNYGYLRAKPVQASLFDYLGPWPWYLLSLEALSLLLFVLCYAPFAIAGYRPSAPVLAPTASRAAAGTPASAGLPATPAPPASRTASGRGGAAT
jgi:hypothetical integral membrane protein (TIGR02206 family)